MFNSTILTVSSVAIESPKQVKSLIQNWEDETIHFLPKVCLAIAVLVIFVLLAKLVKKLIAKFYNKTFKNNSETIKIIEAIVYFFFVLSGIFIGLEILGLERILSNLLAGAGIVGIVAGFAFKDIASNAFGGFLLDAEHPFKEGDWVQMDGAYGTIVKIGAMTTIVKAADGQEIFVPNQIIYSNIFTNFSTFAKKRVSFQITVSYSGDEEALKQMALEELSKLPETIGTESSDLFFTGWNGGNLSLKLQFWIAFNDDNDFQKAISDALIAVKNRFVKENITLVSFEANH